MRGRERREIVLTMRGTEDEESNEGRKEGRREGEREEGRKEGGRQ